MIRCGRVSKEDSGWVGTREKHSEWLEETCAEREMMFDLASTSGIKKCMIMKKAVNNKVNEMRCCVYTTQSKRLVDFGAILQKSPPIY